MALFLFRGPPIWVGGVGANASISANVPAPTVIATGGSVAAIVWATIPDQVFTQNENAIHGLGAYATIAGGYPLRLTLAPGSASLPTGIAWNEAQKSLVATAPPTITTVSGVQLRATSGVLVGATASVAAPVAAMTAIAGQVVATGAFGSITESIPRPYAAMVGEATQVAPPGGVGYPDTYTILDYHEYPFGDIKDLGSPIGGTKFAVNDCPTHSFTDQVWYQVYAQVKGRPAPEPGRYHPAHNGAIIWNNRAGDWADRNNIAQGASPYQTISVAAGFGGWKSADLFTDISGQKNLVRGWLDGTWRNAGLWLRGSNTNKTYWHSKYWSVPAERPYLRLTHTTLGTVDVPCGRSIHIDASTEGAMAQDDILECSGSTCAAMLWFDLSPYTVTDITAAVLWIHGGGPSAQTVNVYRIVNPGDPAGDVGVAPIAAQRLGIAASYPMDVGIENHPSVLWVQRFNPANWRDQWIGGVNGSVTNVADPVDGFYPLPSGDYAWRFRFAREGTLNSDGAGYNLHFSPWRGNSPSAALRLKPKIEIDEIYMRHYLFLPAIGPYRWFPEPNAGKHFGVNMRYGAMGDYLDGCPEIPGMGQSNSGSKCSGFNGASARQNYDRHYTVGNPRDAVFGFGTGDMYHADMEGDFGHDVPWNRSSLGLLRPGVWNCLEMRLKMNSVTDDTQHPRRVISLTQSGGIATATLANAETDPLYAVGQLWNVGGVYANPQQLGYLYCGDHAITNIIDATHFQYAIDPSAPATAPTSTSPVFWICTAPCRGNFDGIIEGWVNGRQAHGSYHWRWRHVKWRTDGGLYGIDSAWIAGFNGGDPISTEGIFANYTSQIIVATDYLGPMVLA